MMKIDERVLLDCLLTAELTGSLPETIGDSSVPPYHPCWRTDPSKGWVKLTSTGKTQLQQLSARHPGFAEQRCLHLTVGTKNWATQSASVLLAIAIDKDVLVTNIRFYPGALSLDLPGFSAVSADKGLSTPCLNTAHTLSVLLRPANRELTIGGMEIDEHGERYYLMSMAASSAQKIADCYGCDHDDTATRITENKDAAKGAAPSGLIVSSY